MKNAKLAQPLKLIGGILLAVAVFLMLCHSDVVRLNPDLNGVPNGQQVAFAKETSVSKTESILVEASLT